ncbi:MAG: hypothetical protein GXY96_07200 [Tissierellia bacterium]|nr:hypothetical protein [Tissierellia bacterium]
MKKIFFIIAIFTLSLLNIGCSGVKEKSLVEKETKEKSLSYVVEKITLSKGFQAINPSVEVLDDTTNLKLLANIGLIESSGIRIDKITKLDNAINIYVTSLQEDQKNQLAIPRAVIRLQDAIEEKAEELKFNIINQNYDLISLKFNRDQILDKIYTDFKIEPSSMPEVILDKVSNNIYWNITFTNIFDKENLESPLINFNVRVDALDGSILSLTKEPISAYIDDGVLLDYIPNSLLLYKQFHVENNIDYETIWIYDLEKEEQNKLYTSKSRILSAHFSPDAQYISVIENIEDKTDIYLIPIEENIAYKITPDNYFHPQLMKWKDHKTLILLNRDDKYSTFLAYDLEENRAERVFKTDKNVDSFDLHEDMILFTEPNENSLDKDIYLYNNEDKSKKIGEGYKISFLDDERIIYLKNIEGENKSVFYIFDMVDNKFEHKIDKNIVNYIRLDDDNFILIEQNNHNNDYTAYKFNNTEKSITAFARINSDKIYYDANREKGYISKYLPFNQDNLSIIYSVDLKKSDMAEGKN